MANRSAYGTMSLVLALVAFLVILLGVFWLLAGLSDKDSNLVLRGIITLPLGFGVGALESFVK